MYAGLQSSKRENQSKTILFLLLFPVLLAGIVFLVFWFGGEAWNGHNGLWKAYQETLNILIILGPVLIIWCLVSFFFQRWLIFSFSGAKEVSRKEEPEIYNIVENLCISRGLPVPKIGIIEQPGKNAFALGWKVEKSWIVFTRGLLEHLDKREIEAVAAHELTHIINKDSLLMLVVVVYIGGISLLGEVLMRSSSRMRSKSNGVLSLLGIVLVLLGYVVYPLIHLAISRKREFLADAGSVELTKDNQAMISALRKIAQEPEVALDHTQMSSMFIASPLKSSWFKTHPSIEDRIKALESY